MVTNTRGDVIELRNGDGTLNTKYTYDAWGKLISMTDATGAALSQNTFGAQNSLRYRGYVYDRETGLYYLQSRYYDPETGRFINADAWESIQSFSKSDYISKNIFTYCRNFPVNLFDANGRDPVSAMITSIYDNVDVGLAISTFIDYDKDIKILLDSEISKDKRRCGVVNDTKGGIAIDFTKGLGSFIYNKFKNSNKYEYACKLLAIYSRLKFKADFAEKYNKKYKKIGKNGKFRSGYQKQREFLFSESCVAKEIYEHFRGYAWTQGYKGISLPYYMKGWGFYNHCDSWFFGSYDSYKKKVKTDIYNAAKIANITEADVWYNYSSKKVIMNKDFNECFVYDYFSGIATAYKYSACDPYYNIHTGIRKTPVRTEKNDNDMGDIKDSDNVEIRIIKNWLRKRLYS